MARLTVKVAAALVLLVGAGLARADEVPISGKWVGKYRNSKGESGDDSLTVREARDGTLRGTWGEIAIEKGERLGDNIFLWQGQQEGRHYIVVARVFPGRREVLINFRATYRESGETRKYIGSSRLRPSE